MESFSKQPQDRVWQRVNMNPRLANLAAPATPDTITSYTVTTTDAGNGQAVTDILGITGEICPYTLTTTWHFEENGYIYFLASGGTTGHRYQFQFLAVTSGGQRIDKDVQMEVIEE